MVFPPLGLLYLSSRLESLGHTTQLFDLNEDDLPRDGDFSQMWVSSTAPQIAEVKRISKATEGWKTRRVLGGASVWNSPDVFKNLGFDLAAAGECDSAEAVTRILELAENPPDDHYAYFPTSPTLDWVLPPNRRWNNRYKCNMKDADGNSYRMTTICGSRGCPMSCAFCDVSRLGKIWDKFTRYEPLDKIESQIKDAAENGFQGVMWYDDILPLHRQRTLAIMGITKKYNMVSRAFARVDLICKHGGYDFLKQLRDGGTIELFLGVESASDEIKKNISKGTTVTEDTKVLHWCRELGIRVKCSFILGLPGESRDTMEQTREWIFRERPDRVQVGRLIIFPSTPLSDHPELFDLKYEERPTDDWFYSGDMGLGARSFVSTSHLTVDEIDSFWRQLVLDLKAAGIPS